MKKIILAAILTLTACSRMLAYDFEAINADGVTIYYNRLSSSMCEVTYGTTPYQGEIRIPETVTYAGADFMVKSIGDRAFWSCHELNAVSVPSSVTYIGEAAFVWCTSLTKTEYASIEHFCSIDYNCMNSNPLYWSKHLYINGKEVTEIEIPNSITTIKPYTFQDCIHLTSVTIPQSVTSIKDYAFYGCSALTSVKIPDSVKEIRYYAFAGCSSLTEIDIPNSVNHLLDGAFSDCSSLTSVTLPKNIGEICNFLFQNCSSLNSIVIGNHIRSIGIEAFYECESLTSVEIQDCVKSIDMYAFSGCTSLTSIVIPSSVTSLDAYVFNGCSSLTSIEFGKGITQIKDKTFFRCSSLSSIQIPEGITYIGKAAFAECGMLATVELPNSLTEIKENAFGYCDALTKVKVYAQEPPLVDHSSSYYFEDAFIYNGNTIAMTLMVPAGTREKYEAADVWKDFEHIIEFDPASLTAVSYDAPDTPDFDLMGRKLSDNESRHGLIIQNGKIRVLR